MTLPNFLVIGAQHAGTSLLHRILELHPDIFVPCRRKQAHYFDRYFDRGLDWYESCFPYEAWARQYRAIGEVAPDYLFEKQVPRRIHETLAECRFIVSLRNPVNRAYAAYLHHVRNYNETRSVSNFLSESRETLHRGCYSSQLTRYFEFFPRRFFLILIYEELVANPAVELDRTAAFLGLEPEGWGDPGALLQGRINVSQIPRFGAAFAYARRMGALLTRNDLDWVVRWAKRGGAPKLFGRREVSPILPEPTRQILEEYYCDEVATLQTLLDVDLRTWWGDFAHRGLVARVSSGLPSAEP